MAKTSNFLKAEGIVREKLFLEHAPKVQVEVSLVYKKEVWDIQRPSYIGGGHDDGPAFLTFSTVFRIIGTKEKVELIARKIYGKKERIRNESDKYDSWKVVKPKEVTMVISADQLLEEMNR